MNLKQYHINLNQKHDHIKVNQIQYHIKVNQKQYHIKVNQKQYHINLNQKQDHIKVNQIQYHIKVNQKQSDVFGIPFIYENKTKPPENDYVKVNTVNATTVRHGVINVFSLGNKLDRVIDHNNRQQN